jgi:hypothetical protein
MLVIEVKGGEIKIDSDGNWTSRDRQGFVHRIKDPVKQARDSKHQLLSKLKESTKWRSRFIRVRHGVIFPDVLRYTGDLRPDMPARLFAFAGDLTQIDQWIDSRFFGLEQSDEYIQPLGPDGIAALDDLLTRAITLNVQLGGGIQQDLKEIRLKSGEQVCMLREMESFTRLTVAGAAGTGKTVLAAEKAIMLAEAGKETLLLCFNRPLCMDLRRQIGRKSTLTISTFHMLAADIAKKAGANPAEHTVEELARHFLVNYAKASPHQYDALIIDEGQDFEQSWLESLEVLLKGGAHGTLYIFYDDNQNITGASSVYLGSLPESRYQLTRNYRNTQKIFRQASRFYRGRTVRPMGPVGTDVRWLASATATLATSAVATRICELVGHHGVQPSDITVLMPTARDAEHFRRTSGSGMSRFGTTDAESRDAGKVVVDSIRRFKGLESPVILLVLPDGMEAFEEVVYTGMTRAQTLLEVFASKRLVETLRERPGTDS